jgi:uncharacterized protein (TIGR03083 family)
VDQAGFLSALELQSTRTTAAAEGRLSRPVGSCPGWEVKDVIGHLGSVYAWAAGAVAGGGERPGPMESAPEDNDGLLSWFVQNRDELLASFVGRAEDDKAWVFVSASPQTVGWWARRQALESLVHRYDVETGAGVDVSPIDPELAVEGCDEYLSQFLPRILARNPVPALVGTFHVHATDAAGEWSLDFSEPGLTRREHSKADTAVRGPAAGLYLWMWNRLTPEEAGLEAFGDDSVVSAWREVQM